MITSFARLSVASLTFAALSVPALASAAEEPSRRTEIAAYPVEIDGHFTFGPENVYGETGFGAGLRLGVPLVTGSLGQVPDNLAISFGGDIVHYENCYFNGRCGANYLMFPVAAQWNVFVLRHVSLFAEGGAYVYKGFFDKCGPGDAGCSAPSDFGILPTVAIGMRGHVAENVAITARIGYPTMTLGLSFM